MPIDIGGLNKWLGVALMALAEYRRGRDAVKSAGDPTSGGELLTDAQLADLLKQDGAALVSKIDALIAKHG